MNKYLKKSFYKEIFESWNNIGKIKSLIILIISILSLILLETGKNTDTLEFYEFLIMSIMSFTFVIFIVIVIKLQSLFGVRFEKPKWNENIITVDSSKILNSIYFVGVLLITSGIIEFLYVGITYQKLEFETFISIVLGISILSGIEMSLKLLKIT